MPEILLTIILFDIIHLQICITYFRHISKSIFLCIIPEYCNVAPNIESKRLPNSPAIPPMIIIGHCGAANSSVAVSTVYNVVK